MAKGTIGGHSKAGFAKYSGSLRRLGRRAPGGSLDRGPERSSESCLRMLQHTSPATDSSRMESPNAPRSSEDALREPPSTLRPMALHASYLLVWCPEWPSIKAEMHQFSGAPVEFGYRETAVPLLAELLDSFSGKSCWWSGSWPWGSPFCQRLRLCATTYSASKCRDPSVISGVLHQLPTGLHQPHFSIRLPFLNEIHSRTSKTPSTVTYLPQALRNRL